MLKVDNTKELTKVMDFNPMKSYYKFVCLIRDKDYKDGSDRPMLTNKDKQEVLVRTWYVDSQESLEKQLPDMLTLTELLKCRLYMLTDRKSTVKTLVTMRNMLNVQLDHFLTGSNMVTASVKALNKIPSSASSVSDSSDSKVHKWLFDVDTKDQEVLQTVVDYCGSSYEATFETKSGYHVVAKRAFDAHRWVELEYNNVDVKDNAMVLVAMG